MTEKAKMTQYEKMTATPIPRLIATLSVPTIISMLVTNIYNLVDTAFVGRLGTSASGAVGIVFGFMAIIQAFGFMFGQGSGSIISRALGAKDTETASRTVSTGCFGSFMCGAAITVIGFLYIDRIVIALGSTETIAPYAKTYISFILAAAPFMAMSFTMNSILRYEGKAALGMIGLMTGAILNIAGDPIFMFAMHMGIAGAGLSTCLSQIVSFGILLGMFMTTRTESRLSLSNVSWHSIALPANIMATGFPSLLRQGLNSFTTVLLNTNAAVYGDAAVAAMSIVSRISFFVVSIGLGIGQGFQPVSGFNYGAKKYRRLREGYKTTIIMMTCVIAVGASIVLLNLENMIGLFRDDPEVIAVGTRALKLQMFSLICLPPCMSTEMLYQSTGRRLGATLLSALRNGLIFIPALLILAQLRGLSGIQEAQPVAQVLALPLTVLLGWMFFRKLPDEDM
jgi:putative MATE family efflux protein